VGVKIRRQDKGFYGPIFDRPIWLTVPFLGGGGDRGPPAGPVGHTGAAPRQRGGGGGGGGGPGKTSFLVEGGARGGQNRERGGGGGPRGAFIAPAWLQPPAEGGAISKGAGRGGTSLRGRPGRKGIRGRCHARGGPREEAVGQEDGKRRLRNGPVGG